MAQETQYCSFRYIFGTVYSEKTEASEISLDHVADSEALDGFILGCAATAVRAANGLHMAAALLVASIGRALLDHFEAGRRTRAQLEPSQDGN